MYRGVERALHFWHRRDACAPAEGIGGGGLGEGVRARPKKRLLNLPHTVILREAKNLRFNGVDAKLRSNKQGYNYLLCLSNPPKSPFSKGGLGLADSLNPPFLKGGRGDLSFLRPMIHFPLKMDISWVL